MDVALKARLIGAAVLVALAVLLIPELLSGRKAAAPTAVEATSGRGTRTFTIELAGSPAETTVTEAAPAVAPPASPAPSANAPALEAASQPASEPQPASAASTTPAPQAEEPSRVARSEPSGAAAPDRSAQAQTPVAGPDAVLAPAPSIPARGGWAVQVGAFGSEAAARKLVDQLRESGYKAYVAPVSRGGRTLHRVRVGPEPERAEAESLLAGLKVRGLPATVVEND
jgi:DedD protein